MTTNQCLASEIGWRAALLRRRYSPAENRDQNGACTTSCGIAPVGILYLVAGTVDRHSRLRYLCGSGSMPRIVQDLAGTPENIHESVTASPPDHPRLQTVAGVAPKGAGGTSFSWRFVWPAKSIPSTLRGRARGDLPQGTRTTLTRPVPTIRPGRPTRRSRLDRESVEHSPMGGSVARAFPARDGCAPG